MQTAIIKSRLPNGHKELSWIKGDGASWIETNLLLDGTERIEIKNYAPSSSNAFNYLLGAQQTIRQRMLVFANLGTVSVYKNNQSSLFNVLANQNNNIVIDNNDVYVNNVLIYSFTTESKAISVPLALFGANSTSGVVNQGSNFSLSEIIIGDKADFIPDLYNNQVGMYDLVSQTFFPNAGTGSFIAGPEVKPIIPVATAIVNPKSHRLPAGYTEIEGLSSTWNTGKYIDLGIVPTNDMRIEFYFNTSPYGGTYYWFYADGNYCFYCNSNGGYLNMGDVVWNNHKIYSAQELVVILDAPNGTITVNGQVKATGTPNLSGTSTLKLRGTTNQVGIGTWRRCAIYQNNVLIHDYYSCIRNSDNKIGMIDKVEKLFKTNTKGDLTLSGSIIPPIIPVTSTHKYLLPPDLTTIQGIKEYLANPLVSLAKKREVLVAREGNDWTFDMNITNPDTGTSYVMPCRILEVDNYTQLVDGVEKTFVGAKTQFAYALPDSLPIDAREQQRATGNFESGLYYYWCNNASGGNVAFTALTAGTDYTIGDTISDWESQHSGQYVFVHTSSGASSFVRYGSNIFHESNIDKWLNGSGKDWFVPSHIGDVLDTTYNNKTGFKDWFASSDIACIRDNVGYGVYEPRGYELPNDTMYRQFTLLSGTEVAGSVNNYEGTVIEYWKWKNGGVIGNGANADRVMQKITAKTTNVTCWLRSPYRSNYADAWYVTASGNISTYNSAYVAYAIAPLFTI